MGHMIEEQKLPFYDDSANSANISESSWDSEDRVVSKKKESSYFDFEELLVAGEDKVKPIVGDFDLPTFEDGITFARDNFHVYRAINIFQNRKMKLENEISMIKIQMIKIKFLARD